MLPHRYYIAFTGREEWAFSSGPELSQWLDCFAKILGLLPCNNPIACHRLHFTSREPDNCWKCEELRNIRLFYSPEGNEIRCVMEPAEIGEELIPYIKMSQSLFPIFRYALFGGGLPLHAALLERDGNAVAIAAAGDTGKTTCAKRIPPPWNALSDDLCLILPDNSGRFAAHPFPTWSRYFQEPSCNESWKIEENKPLNAIFFLEQADIDNVSSMGKGEAAVGVTYSADQILGSFFFRLNKNDVRRYRRQVFENACGLAQKIPAYRLKATLDGRFWNHMEAVL